MQRKLMAAAVAGVFAAPALVLAQSSTVQIYGRITYEYGYADPGSGRPSTDVAQRPGGSAIGFRGEEKLGGGLTAWFQCETSADVRGIDQVGLCSRNSAVGFKGSWGNLHFGRWDSPFKRAINMGKVGVEDTGLLGSAFVFTGGSGGVSAITKDDRDRWKRREVGWTYYESPKFSGFQVLAAFTPGNAATGAVDGDDNDKPRVLSIGGMWKQGPFQAGLAYEEHSDFGATNNPAVGDLKDKAWSIAGAYTFANKVKVGVSYIDAKYETSTATEIKKKNFLVGLDWKVGGPHSVHFGYVNAGDSKGNDTVGGAGPAASIGDVAPTGSSTGADWFSIAYQYAFSKRTSARIGYVNLDNDQNASYQLGGLSNPASSGEGQDAIVLLLKHNF